MDGLMNLFGNSVSGYGDLLTPEQKQALQRQSVMAMASSLLKASGPSPTRTTLGQALGGAYEAGQGAMQAGQKGAVEQMLLRQKLMEAKTEQERKAAWQRMLQGGAGAPVTPEQALAMPSTGPVGPTVQRDAMIGATPQAAPGGVFANLSPQQRALLSAMPMADAQKWLMDRQSNAVTTLSPEESAKLGLPPGVLAQRTATGEVKVQYQPEATATEIKILNATGKPVTFENVMELRRSGAANVSMGGKGLQLTPGQESIDKKFGDSYLEWRQGGGADAAANIAQIGTVLQRLEAGQPLTGPLIGVQPDFVRAITNPAAQGAIEQVQEVVQRNLRAVLGAQFTQAEGDRLIARAYNPSLPPQQNAARLRKLFEQISIAAQQKQAMGQYFDVHGTLRGYRGPEPNINNFYKALEERAAPAPGEVIGAHRFKGGNPNDEANWERVR